MTDTVIHAFTFGQSHTSTYPMEGRRLPNCWVEVHLPAGSSLYHRELFIEYFTKVYCPRPAQFAFEYRLHELKREYFLEGLLCVITEEGIQ